MAEYGLSQALVGAEPPADRDPLAKLRAQLQLDETQATGQGIMGMLADWFKWRTRPDQAQPLDPMAPLSEQASFDPTDVPFQPGSIAGKIGRITGRAAGGIKLSDLLNQVKKSIPSLYNTVDKLPQRVDFMARPLSPSTLEGISGLGPKQGAVWINSEGTAPPFQALTHEMLHLRQRAKGTAPSPRVARRAVRELSSDELSQIEAGYRHTSEAELVEENMIQGLVKLLARKRPQAERVGQTPGGPAKVPPSDYGSWWAAKELQHPSPAQEKEMRKLYKLLYP